MNTLCLPFIFLDFNFQNTSEIFKIVTCEYFKIRFALGCLLGPDEKCLFILFLLITFCKLLFWFSDLQ